MVRIARFFDEASLKWRIASQELVRLMTAACGPFPARLLGAAQAWRSNVPRAGAAIDGRWPVAKKWG